MSTNSAPEPVATADATRFVTEKVAEEVGTVSPPAGSSPASKHSSTAGGGDAPQTAANKGGVPDGNCSPGGVPEKGKRTEKSYRKADVGCYRFRNVLIRGR